MYSFICDMKISVILFSKNSCVLLKLLCPVVYIHNLSKFQLEINEKRCFPCTFTDFLSCAHWGSGASSSRALGLHSLVSQVSVYHLSHYVAVTVARVPQFVVSLSNSLILLAFKQPVPYRQADV